MPSDLQRVARGLVDCLDEVPQVVLHLQRTADRCRENAALAIAASHGRATVAAQQLDAAARACEAAAHYLSMAPPKAKSWAERLIGDSRTTNRPSADSADRNKATLKVGDVADRDAQGRTKRLSAPFKPSEPVEESSPLIKVARKAFEEFRKQQEKDEESREQPEEPLELEILVDRDGKIALLEHDEDEEKDREDREERARRPIEITVDLGESIQELLEAMAESGNQTWEHATFLITPERVTATFDYPEEPPKPPVVDIELPDLPQVELPDFDPAFQPRALGTDFVPGVHDAHDSFKPKEVDIARRLQKEGWRVDARLADHSKDEPNPDAMVRRSGSDKGRVVEFKTLRGSSANTARRNINDASGQVPPDGEVVIDGRNGGLTEADALRAFRRALGQPGKTVAAAVHLILGDGRLVTYTKEP
jgi:hypothetical protein